MTRNTIQKTMLLTMTILFSSAVAVNSDLTAPMAFAAPLVVDFKQCANENPVLGDCIWINGIVQQSNSLYFENDDLEQRIVFTDIQSTSGDNHVLTFSHEFTKNGIHAFDFLTAYDQGPNPLTNLNPCGPDIGPPSDLDVTCTNLRTGINTIMVDIPDDVFVSKDGAVQDKINAYETTFGNRQIIIYGDEPITTANLAVAHTVPNGGDTGDSDNEYVLTWTSNSTQILIEMAVHMALGGDPIADDLVWGFDLGSSSIAGGPYHVRLLELDGNALGNQDNQVQGKDILPIPNTTITLIKNVINDDGGIALPDDFMLTINGTIVLSGSTTVVDANTPIAIDETLLAGYQFVSITGDAQCPVTLGGNVTLSEGDNITCTITNDDQVENPAKTLGFWKNHEDATTAHLPMTIGDLDITDFDTAKTVFKANTKNAHDMLAAQLLAAELNVWNNVPICAEVDDAIIQGQEILANAGYVGPNTTVAPQKDDKESVNDVKDILDDFNNNGCS